MRLTEENREWATWDNTKMGLQDYKGGIYDAFVTKVYHKNYAKIYRLEFEQKLAKEYGLPYFYVKLENGKYDVRWFDKKSSRLPQAFWLKFKGIESNWELNKFDEWIKADEVIGSPLISVVNKGVRCETHEIVTYDAAVVAPFGKNLLRYTTEKLDYDMHFILYDNIWNTNFPMWYSDDGLFRFEVKKN